MSVIFVQGPVSRTFRSALQHLQCTLHGSM